MPSLARFCNISTFFLILLASAGAFGQPSFKNDLYYLQKLVAQQHVQPRPVDNNLARDVVESLLEIIDADKLYYTEPEILKIKAYQGKIVSDINNHTWTFLPLFQEITHASLTRARKNIVAITNQPVNLNEKMTVTPDTVWAADEVSLRKRLSAVVKLKMLTQLQLNGEPGVQSIERCQRAVEATLLRSVDKLLQHHFGFDQFIGNVFLKAYLRAHDPHSVYLSPLEMQNFVTSLSSQGFHFGFVLDEDLKGNVFVKSLVPGSPAWKSGEIHRGDVIEGMAWRGKPKVDAALLSIEQVEEIFMESNHEVMDLYLRSSGGVVRQVTLKKELQPSDEDVVRSSVLISDSRVGYISLPDFYSSWDQPGSSEAANDVAKAIIKLKKQNIKGLILDLRFNGGGSLEEAVAMAGIFIDAGPMGLLRPQAGDAITFKDFNRGIAWDGPLVVMVNGSSASASEFVAAALQDYNRALIVGSRTYGKGTAQSIFSLEPGKPTLNLATVGKNTKTGYATVTTERCYRISGKSVQYTGVIPDIEIPELSDYAVYRESRLRFALKPDEIFKKVYYQPLAAITMNAMNNNSRERIAGNLYFKEVNNVLQLLNEDYRGKSQPLQKEEFEKRFKALSISMQALEKISATETGSFTIEFLPSDLQRMAVDEYFQELNDSWSTALRKDYSLAETINIISDYIRLSKNP